MKLTESEMRFWNEYLASLSIANAPSNYFVESYPAGNSCTTDGLIALYLSGVSTRTDTLIKRK